MFKEIITDFVSGLIASVRVDLVIKPLYTNNKLRRLIIKLIKYNICMHFLPFILISIVENVWQIELNTVTDVLGSIITIFSNLFHLLHFMDLMSIICVYSQKTSTVSGGALDLISLTLTMTIYQTMIYLTTIIIRLIFSSSAGFVLMGLMLNTIILSIYHSFYCYNNLWQYKKLKLCYRIDIHEKLWPYYLGYGLIGTILYLQISNPFIYGLYNMYMVLILSLPFMTKPIYPHNIMPYPSINMSLFSYFIGLMLTIARKSGITDQTEFQSIS